MLGRGQYIFTFEPGLRLGFVLRMGSGGQWASGVIGACCEMFARR